LTKICFILDELYPADRGGIARLMHNVIHHAKQLENTVDIHVVLARARAQDDALEDSFSGVATLHYFRSKAEIARRFGLARLNVSPLFARQDIPFTRDLQVLDSALEAAESCGGFDHIEVPDHMGLGALILQAKRAGYAFQNTEITCRIHSSLSAITTAEPFHHARSDWLAPRLEMERYALENADRVIAHLPTIATFNQEHFGFGESWMDKVEVEFPPVIWPVPDTEAPQAPGEDFIFTSRFQPFKRPALFIKAAIAMLDAGSDFEGQFRLISYGFNPEYIDYLRLMVPGRYRSRILLQTNVPAADRLDAIRSGIIVQPSNFESLCALAYEASTANRPLLLARDCRAFGDDPHWVDQKNCLLFDPDPTALAAVMEQARQWHPVSQVDTKADTPYFFAPAKKAKATSAATLGILVGPIETSAQQDAVSKHFEGQPRPVKTFGNATIPAKDSSIKYHRFTEAKFNGQQWKDLAHSFDTTAVLLCAPDALPEFSFLDEGATVVQSGTAYSSNGVDPVDGALLVYPGKFDTMSIAEPRICPPCLLLHKNDLGLITPDEDEALLAKLITRLARSRCRLVLSPAPHVRQPSFNLTAPLQQHLGYEAAPVWGSNLRWVGVAVRPSINNGVLKKQPATLTLKSTKPLVCSNKQAVQLNAGPAKAYALVSDQNLESRILALSASHKSGKNDISVSLHQAAPDVALTRHAAGQNIRQLKKGQSYQMRWGPIWEAGNLTLVVESSGESVLLLDNPILTSRA